MSDRLTELPEPDEQAGFKRGWDTCMAYHGFARGYKDMVEAGVTIDSWPQPCAGCAEKDRQIAQLNAERAEWSHLNDFAMRWDVAREVVRLRAGCAALREALTNLQRVYDGWQLGRLNNAAISHAVNDVLLAARPSTLAQSQPDGTPEGK